MVDVICMCRFKHIVGVGLDVASAGGGDSGKSHEPTQHALGKHIPGSYMLPGTGIGEAEVMVLISFSSRRQRRELGISVTRRLTGQGATETWPWRREGEKFATTSCRSMLPNIMTS